MQPTLEQKNIELETILKDTDLQLEVDINLIEQVLINLVVNAIEAVKDSPTPKIVLISLCRANNQRSIIKMQIMEMACLLNCWIKFLFLFSAQKKMAAVLVLVFANRS